MNRPNESFIEVVTDAARQIPMELPEIASTIKPALVERVQAALADDCEHVHALGRLESLALQLCRIQLGDDDQPGSLRLESPQLVVFAADHGLADEGVSVFPQDNTRKMALRFLEGQGKSNALAEQFGFAATLVDAGVASHLPAPGAQANVPLLLRKIGYGTRNMVLTQAMSVPQALSALQAGMDVVRHLPGNVLALSNIGVAGNACAALLLSRLCGVPLVDACGKDQTADPALGQHRLERLFAAASRHRRAVAPLDALAALGGFEVAMMSGAMIRAASERRVVLVDGFVAGAAALVARALVPAVSDYLVFTHRSADPGHRLLLIHMQATPLLDLELRTSQGIGALLAWPMLQAAQRLLSQRG